MGGLMRLLSVLFTVATVTFLLAGVAAAQERATGQIFETRETTGSEGPPRTPTAEQSARDAQANVACPGAALITSVGPTDEDLVTSQPFTVTGESFRLTYETTDADESGLPFVDVTVLDEAGKEVGGRVIFEEGTQQELVRAGPGRFDIETTADDLKYKLTIEDCTGDGNPSGGPGGDGGASDDQYGNDNGNQDDVIDDTISDEPLPNTGGAPLLGIMAFGSILIFGAFAVLRPVVRRDS